MRQKSEKERQLWAQFDALQLGTGWVEDDIGKLQILVEDVYGDSHPAAPIWMLSADRQSMAYLRRGHFRHSFSDGYLRRLCSGA